MKPSKFVIAAFSVFAGMFVGIALERYSPGVVSGFSLLPEVQAAAATPASTNLAPPGLKRTLLLTNDAPGGNGYEIVMVAVELAPGASSGKHRHNGIEVGYVLEGTATLEHDGRPTATLAAGSSFMNNGVHNAVNRSSAPAKVLAIYVVEKGKPLAVTVP